MKTKIVTGLAMVAALGLAGCQGNERLSEVSTVQSQAQLQQEKEFRDNRVRELEKDLSKRQTFFQGVAGSYEGKVTTSDGEYLIRIRLVPTVPPYKPGDRVRTPEEVTLDLSNLYFRAQIVQWKQGSTIGVMGCRVDNIRPDLLNGSISIASADCPSFYQFYISNLPMDGVVGQGDVRTIALRSRDLASTLLDGKEEPVTTIIGEVYPTSATSAFRFSAERSKE